MVISKFQLFLVKIKCIGRRNNHRLLFADWCGTRVLASLSLSVSFLHGLSMFCAPLRVARLRPGIKPSRNHLITCLPKKLIKSALSISNSRKKKLRRVADVMTMWFSSTQTSPLSPSCPPCISFSQSCSRSSPMVSLSCHSFSVSTKALRRREVHGIQSVMSSNSLYFRQSLRYCSGLRFGTIEYCLMDNMSHCHLKRTNSETITTTEEVNITDAEVWNGNSKLLKLQKAEFYKVKNPEHLVTNKFVEDLQAPSQGLNQQTQLSPNEPTKQLLSVNDGGHNSKDHAPMPASSDMATNTPSDGARFSGQQSSVSGSDLRKNLSKINGKVIVVDNISVAKEVDMETNTPSDCARSSAQQSSVVGPDLRKNLSNIYGKVLVVDNISVAKKVVGMLTERYRHLVHACDTEVAEIEVKQETPVDHGEIICFSIYSGPDADFGNGKSCIWVDVLEGGGRDILIEFAPFFEDPFIKKVWHNYSFDNHVIENYGLKLSGFHADTMHMARLWDSSRRTEGGYSLEALTGDWKVMSYGNKDTPGQKEKLSNEDKLIGKISMKTIFGRRKVKKDGSDGKIIIIPPVEELQREERIPWICYSALDSISTLKLYESLKRKLTDMKWLLEGVEKGSMLDFYETYWQPFGELLVKMETEGMMVDRAFLAEIEKVAIKEQQVAVNRFRNWASKYCSDAKYMNVGSDTQLRQLFFGGIKNRRDETEILPKEKKFKVPNIDEVIEEGKETPSKFRNITLSNLCEEMPTELYTASGWPSVSIDALRTLAGKVSAEYEFTDDDLELLPYDSGKAEPEDDISPEDDTSAYGTAYAAFGRGQKGKEACHAIASLCEVCSIDSLISNFILPLQSSHISGKNGRIHCSLNINTETGRLSARRPNLQNQPALEKDRYKIRQAFIAAPGNSLVVADYGQLELRILAHITNCKSMLDAFRAGGDFHSRTAMNMYPYIREAVEQKRVLLEWHPQPGEDKPPVPLLKDAFASERRKAKMLNFSIAYGKTPMGLARDWKVPVKEAKKTVDLWYKERQEVLEWQEERKTQARHDGCVNTLLGRARHFPRFDKASYSQKSHIERAAINAPVQGSAADVAMCAMLEISKNERLKKLGWKLLLQVHDEVILEGPTESAEEARALVVACMSKPFDGQNILKVDLSVDAKCALNWYSAK